MTGFCAPIAAMSLLTHMALQSDIAEKEKEIKVTNFNIDAVAYF
jgi:hypothetical protein